MLERGIGPGWESGPIPEAPSETWNAVLSGPSTRIARIAQRSLVERGSGGGIRDVRNRANLPRLSSKQILVWAIAHHERTREWPTKCSGPIPDCPGETWMGVHNALRSGSRGLQGGSSLAKLLDAHGLKPNALTLPPLSLKRILAWADAHLTHKEAAEEILGTDRRLAGRAMGFDRQRCCAGIAGLPGGASLAHLLARTHRGARHRLKQPRLTVEQIWQWAVLYFQRVGRRPAYASGPIAEAPGETWNGVEGAFRQGRRGLPRSTLARFGGTTPTGRE